MIAGWFEREMVVTEERRRDLLRLAAAQRVAATAERERGSVRHLWPRRLGLLIATLVRTIGPRRRLATPTETSMSPAPHTAIADG